ncbi:probable cytochrome P450 6a21 [Eupeodes corollae]|uniref:probable cytochrome P450 6a21 n=1 Tax=Eupeodes corollae TaxID=290404 RepID=UPI002492E02C|nr:probable cytochrome P450 6a21 [Eupeodes corollae]
MSLLITVLCGIGTIVSLVFVFIRYRMSYWKQRQIPHDKPAWFLGNIQEHLHQSDAIKKLYNKFIGTGPFCGLYYFMTPAIVALDLDFIKDVLIKDFNKFVERGFFYNEIDDPLSANLFALEEKQWRQMRHKLSPTFTANKIKTMFPGVIDVGHRFVETLSEIIDGADGSEIIEVKDLNARFTTDVIATCAFGIECNSLADPNAQFRKYGRIVFEEPTYHSVIMGFMQSCPKLARKLKLRLIRKDVEDFFLQAVRRTVEYREQNNIQKNDFMSILIDVKNNKSFVTEDGQQISTGLTMEEVAAQAFLFWIAGFETSSATMSYAIYALARNTDVQEKLRTTIDEVLEKHNGELTYESLKEMHYLDQVFDETLRMYTVVPTLQRIANTDYYASADKKYKIDKGTLIFIPIEAIHSNPDIYPNPTKFDPERFSPEEKAKREALAYLPFGEGPRNCIGLKFGRMLASIGLALLIKNFKFSVCEETPKDLQFDPAQILLVTPHGIRVKVEKV